MRRTILVSLLILFAASVGAAALDTLTVCSFNINQLGYYAEKNVRALAHVLANYDVVVIQGIVAPPYDGTFPNGDPYQPNGRVAEFFDEMTQRWGYSHVLSEEDTGKRLINHSNEPWTEWFVVFYDPAKLEPAEGLPQTFLAEDVTANPVFDRVPHAFSLRHLATGFDFVLISVHLPEGSTEASGAKRAEELEAISAWIDGQTTRETEYIVLGSMNFADCSEILTCVPSECRFLNPTYSGDCLATDASLAPSRPYDGVLFTQRVEVDYVFGLRVIDLVAGLAAVWNPFGEPIETSYGDLGFVRRISDHNPIVFKFQLASGDWD
jgi:hypothetical protein